MTLRLRNPRKTKRKLNHLDPLESGVSFDIGNFPWIVKLMNQTLTKYSNKRQRNHFYELELSIDMFRGFLVDIVI